MPEASRPGTVRVALVTHGYLAGGGIPSVAQWLKDGLTAAGGYGVDVHDMATSKVDPNSRRLIKPASWFRRSLMQTNGELTRWGANAVELEPMRYRPRRELSSVLRRYDVIQVVSGSAALAAAVIGTGPPVIVQFASPIRNERAAMLASRGLAERAARRGVLACVDHIERAAIAGADGVLVENEAAATYARECGQPRVLKAFPGVDTNHFTPPPNWDRAGYLLSVCRLNDPRKGLDRLVSTYAELVSRWPDAPKLVLAGRNNISKTLATQIEVLGLSTRVQILRDVPPAELPRLYRGASVYVQTSLEEGYGVSVVEAMASGVPVVATATDGTRETVSPGRTGWLVPQESPKIIVSGMAERILAVLGMPDDKMSRAAREQAVVAFSGPATLRAVTEFYASLVGPQGGDRVRL